MFVLNFKVLFFFCSIVYPGKNKGAITVVVFFLSFCSVVCFLFVGVKFALHFLRPRGVALSRLRTKISLIRYKAVAFKFI